MVYKGEIVVVSDPDLRDMYCAEVVRGDEENLRNILVRILYPIRYPIQHSIIYKDRANENPPYAAGQVVRLAFVRRAMRGDEKAYSYDAAFDKCLKEYCEGRLACYQADEGKPDALKRYHVDPKEFEILERHTKRQFHSKRAFA